MLIDNLVSSLYILGLFESDPPRLLTWLLTRDLVSIFFQMLSQTPPRYRTDELLNIRRSSPAVTGYRALTSLSVTVFGIFKAYFTYENRPAAASAFEWSFGIIITSM
jgi:hypothetical protein